MSPSNPSQPVVMSPTGDRAIRLTDGRDVLLRILGAPDGVPVIGLHGTPGSRIKFVGAHEVACTLGIRLIALDRWGYGGTDAPSRRNLERYGDDLGSIADMLGIGRFGILAISGGGPFGAMAAARLGERVLAVALVCPVGPVAGAASDGTRPFHRFCFNGLPRVPGAVRLVFGAYDALLRRAPSVAVGLLTSGAAPADRALMADAGRCRELAETHAAGLAKSVSGTVIDMALFSRPWGAIEPLKAPTRMWLGTEDRSVPLPAARLLAQLTGAEIVEKHGYGHYWIVEQWREVLEWLADPRRR